MTTTVTATAHKIEIWCGVLGDGSIFSVKIARNVTVEKLRLEIAKKINEDPQVYVAAHRIKLYTLEDPQIQMWRLNDDRSFGSTFPTREGELHVLMKLPNTERPVKRQQTGQVVWQNADGDFSPLWLRDDDRFLTLPHRYVEGSGLATAEPNGAIVLYRRDALQEQWDEIQRCVIDCHAHLYDVGAPGTGKSCAAYAFACCRVDQTVGSDQSCH